LKLDEAQALYPKRWWPVSKCWFQFPKPACHGQVWEFVLRNQPVVIEDAVNADDFPPFFDFADFDYLRERCGHRYVKVKGDSCWDNKGRQLFLNDPTIDAWSEPFGRIILLLENHGLVGKGVLAVLSATNGMSYPAK